jgi:hypothetical protein
MRDRPRFCGVSSRRAAASIACHGVLVVFVAAAISCSDPPRLTTPTPPPSPPPVANPFPPLTGAKTTYKYSKPLSYAVRGFTEVSEFVLYESGTFCLDYKAFAPYCGSYEQSDDRMILLHFGAGDRVADATGTLIDDFMEVRFTDTMQHSDFENAVYHRSSQ